MFQSILIIILMLFSFITQAALPTDPIQRCLDVRRLVDYTSRQKMAAKEPGVLRFKFHKISASELPLNNPKGNMAEVIKALNNQIENCAKHRGEYQTVTIAGRNVKRHEWCMKTNRKMLALAKAAHGDFQKYLSSIKNEFDWYKSEGCLKIMRDLKRVSFNLRLTMHQLPLKHAAEEMGLFYILSTVIQEWSMSI